MHLLSMVKLAFLLRHLIISLEIFYWTQVTRKNFGLLHISMTYGSPSELIINYVVMFLTYYGMEQYLHTNISKYGVWEYTSSMYVPQEINLMIGHIGVILWDMQLLRDLLSTGNQVNLFFIHRSHHVWFDEYNSWLSIEYKHTPVFLPIFQDPEVHIHESDLLNLITHVNQRLD